MIVTTVEIAGVIRLQNQSLPPLNIGGVDFSYHRFSLGKPNESDRLRSNPRRLTLDTRLITLGGIPLGEAIRIDGGGIDRLVTFKTYDVATLDLVATAAAAAIYREQVTEVRISDRSIYVTTGTDSKPLRNWVGTI
jgi:hypothetical protein